jgi:hypothetical protein
MDTFFSGSSDVVLPEGGVRRSVPEPDPSATDLESHAPYFCERCDESIPLSALASGRARLVTGLAFCARCAPLLEEERYQIYFCDRCGVSIPLERIEGGEALAGDGHIYCVRCRRRSPRLARRVLPAGAVLLAAGALFLLALAIWPEPSPPSRLPAELERVRARFRLRLEEAREEAIRRHDAVEVELREIEALDRELDRLRADLRALRASDARGDSTQPGSPDGR